jgi:hypothetical protein
MWIEKAGGSSGLRVWCVFEFARNQKVLPWGSLPAEGRVAETTVSDGRDKNV